MTQDSYALRATCSAVTNNGAMMARSRTAKHKSYQSKTNRSLAQVPPSHCCIVSAHALHTRRHGKSTASKFLEPVASLCTCASISKKVYTMTESREHPLNLSSTVETDLLPRQDLASACQPLCAPGNCGGSTCSLSRKRSLFTVVRSQNETGFGNETFDIHARTLSDSDEEGPVQITKYLKEKNLDNPTILGLCADGGAYESYCTQKAFASFPTDSQSYVGTGPTELTGCTVLTVVSARAVYMVCCTSSR